MAVGGIGPALRDTLRLPPAFRLTTLRELGDAFSHAQAIAPASGAGTVVWARRFDLAEFAIVIEPDEPLALARRAFHVGMAALAEAIASLCPAGIPVAIEWPGVLRFDRSIVGGGRLAWPESAREDETPDWLVFGAMLRLHAMKEIEPGLHTMGASLFDAGFDDADAGQLVEAFARHLLALSDRWARDGFAPVGAAYAHWLQKDPSLTQPLIGDDGAALADALRAPPAWFHVETGEPKL